ncbi:MAG: hypothetical protein ACJ72H_12220 [Candidatus Sulfotelmatobacter sp.]
MRRKNTEQIELLELGSAGIHVAEYLTMPGRSSTVIEVLRTTLEQLEQTHDFASDDRALRELKSSITRTIAELELRSNPALSEPRSD